MCIVHLFSVRSAPTPGQDSSWMILGLFALVACLLVAGCDSTTSSTANDFIAENATLNLKIDAFMGDRELQGILPKEEALNVKRNFQVNGRLITLQTAHMYISEVALVRTDGSTLTFPDTDPPLFIGSREPALTAGDSEKVFLFRHADDQDKHSLGFVETGTYTGIRFKLGIEGPASQINASRVFASEHPLGVRGLEPTYWSQTSGYIFLRMDGQLDFDKDGRVDSPWAVRLSSPTFVHSLTFDQNFTLAPGTSAEIRLKVDYAQLLAGLDYGDFNQWLCCTANNPTLAQKVTAEIPHAFSFVEVRQLGSIDSL